MLAILFENSKIIMLVTWLEDILNVVRNNRCLKIKSHRIGRVTPSGTSAEV